MKQTINLLLIIICTALVTSCGEATQTKEETTLESSNEDPGKAMQDVVEAYQTAYNNEDEAAIKDMFTADAVRNEADGSVINGQEAIAKLYADAFEASDTKLTITQNKAELQADGSIHANGTWEVTGKTSTGEDINRKGTYSVIDVKDNGKWKIKKQVITEE